MTNTFKVGDKVRFVNNDGTDSRPHDNAHDAVVLEVSQDLIKAQFPNITIGSPDGFITSYPASNFRLRETAPSAGNFIVVRQKNGFYEPAAKPVKHPTSEAAETEAQRLAKSHHGYSFVVLEVGKAFQAEININVKEVTA